MVLYTYGLMVTEKNGAITLYLSNLDDPTSPVNYLTEIMGGGGGVISYFL